MEQGIEGVCDSSKVLNKLLIEVAEAKKGLDILNILWGSYILKFGYIAGVRGYSVMGDGISKVSEGGFDPLTLTGFNFEVCLPDLGEDLPEVVHVFF